MNALIVDDEDPARVELRFLLRSHPQVRVVAEAATLGQAREALARHRIDIVFLDIHLLGEDGLDLGPELPASARVVVVTGDDAQRTRAARLGKVDFLLKPVEPAALASALGTAR